MKGSIIRLLPEDDANSFERFVQRSIARRLFVSRHVSFGGKPNRFIAERFTKNSA
jgi:hypothetical protein